MSVNITLDEGAIMPNRAHKTDAGYDLYAREQASIQPGESHVFDTGVHIAIPEGYAGELISKSGLNTNHGLISTGLIDSGYTGSIKVKLYNQGDYSYIVRKGDKISQLVIFPVFTPDLVVVDKLDSTDRGDNGFGSTGT